MLINENSDTNYSALFELLKRFINLKVENARLTVAERMTLLLSGFMFYMIVILFAVCIIGFLSVSLAQFLSESLSEHWAYMIVAGMYATFILLLFLLRKPLIVNPIARFMSQLIVEPPENK